LVSLQLALKIARKYKHAVPVLDFTVVTPSAGGREVFTSKEDQAKLFNAMPRWLLRVTTLSRETGLSESDIMRLTDNMVFDALGVIKPEGGRKKTGVKQISPLTDNARKIIAEVRE